MSSVNPIYPSYSVVGDRYTYLVTGVETNGAFAMFEAYVPAGNGTPPHVHHREDEMFYVIKGEFEFIVAGESKLLGAGDFLLGQRGVPHNFRNVGSSPGRMLITVTPAGFEDFFAEIGIQLASKEDMPIQPTHEDIEKLIATAPKYGLEIIAPH
jgi:quercetin dioxygenase-like cupin family protein